MSYNVRFLQGLRENYNNLLVKDPNTFYYVDNEDLYLGNILLSSADDVRDAVGRIELNESAIQDLRDELDALVDPEGTGGGSISSQISELRDALTTKINANATAIENEVKRAQQVESGLRTDVDKAIGDISDLVDLVADNESDIEEKVSTLSETVGENTSAINAFGTSLSTLEGKVTEAEGDIDDLEAAMSTVETAINTLIGEDADKSVRDIAIEELVNQLVAPGAAENLNELHEIAAWIQQHPEDASAMNLAIQENADAIQTITTEQGTQNTSITSLQEAIAAINDTENGILASANAYTDAEIIEVGNSISGIEGDIADLQSQIDDIVDEDGGILASAQAAIESAISELTSTLGTAAYAAVEDFDAAGAADEALEAAKTYTNTALTWGEIPASEAVE